MKYLILGLSLISFSALSSVTAIIDSGIDYQHTAWAKQMWMNPGEELNNRDDDGNSYQDDIYGWNFANDIPDIIDYSLLGTFSSDVYTFFEIQGKMMLGTATEADIEWMRAKREDKEFISQLQVFGNFVHGTHVAGIAAQASEAVHIMGLKIIPTQASAYFKPTKERNFVESNEWRMKMLKGALVALVGAQTQMLTDVGSYIESFQVDVANGSFGTSYRAIQPIMNIGFKIFFWRAPTEDELHEVTLYFLNELITQSKAMVDASPKTLFVFAAGNDGMNNDEFPTSPANIKADNTISVAATYGSEYLAPFSNYGKLVDVAAPGMLIESSIPGNEVLKVSGTSQAAPYVANLAARIKDVNPALTPKEIKTIIMETVDKKSFLELKVASGGTVNIERALEAAKLSLKKRLSVCTREARKLIADEESTIGSVYNLGSIMPLPLTPQFVQ